MTNYFEQSIKFVIEQESGYVNNPHDTGGETKFGISKRAYPNIDIAALTLAEAKEIYKRDYWVASGCEQMEWPLCCVVLDTAVNCGLHKAVEWLNESTTWTDILFKRLWFYINLNKPEFIKGWCRRVIALWEYCKTEEHPISE